MANGWNLWVQLECIGVVSGCCCKEVYRYSRNISIYSNCISSFAAASLHISSFFIFLFCSCECYFCAI